MKHSIREPILTDRDHLVELLEKTITNNFVTLGIVTSHHDDLKKEITCQVNQLDDYFSRKADTYLIATQQDIPLGTAAFGSVNEIIKKNVDFDLTNVPEIKSVYVDPDYQRQGIGQDLFREIIERMFHQGISEFVLDCGYGHSQPFWKKILGEPTFILPDFFGPGAHHMIWRGQVDVCLHQL